MAVWSKWMALGLSSLWLWTGCGPEAKVTESPIQAEANGIDPGTLSSQEADSPGLNQPVAENLTMKEGSAQQGHDKFYAYGCWQCHTLGDEEAPGMRDGNTMGPDLADVGNRLSVEELMQSIQDPNAVIPEPAEEYTENGVSYMPSFNDPQSLPDLRDIVQFLHQCRIPQTSKASIKPLTDATFASTLSEAKGMALLTFSAEWCFTCLEMAPDMEALASAWKDRIRVYKIHVEDNPVLVHRFVKDVMFPCHVLWQDGKVVSTKYGGSPDGEHRAFLEAWIEPHLRQAP